MREEIRKAIATILIEWTIYILPEGLFKLKLKVFVRDNMMDL